MLNYSDLVTSAEVLISYQMHSTTNFNLLTPNFTLQSPLYFQFTIILSGPWVNKISHASVFLTHLLLLIPLIIQLCLTVYVHVLDSMELFWISFSHTCNHALSLFLPMELNQPVSLSHVEFLKALFLAPSFPLSTLHHWVNSCLLQPFITTYMPMILSYTSHFHLHLLILLFTHLLTLFQQLPTGCQLICSVWILRNQNSWLLAHHNSLLNYNSHHSQCLTTLLFSQLKVLEISVFFLIPISHTLIRYWL